MNQGLFFKHFPVPHSLVLGGTGLDISDQSVKFLTVTPEDGYYQISALGKTDIPLGLIEKGKVINKDGLAEALEEFRLKHKLKFVTVSLPEETSYVIRIRMPFMPENELRSAIELQLEEHIPLPASEVAFDYEIFSRPLDENGCYDLSVSIVPINVLIDYRDAIDQANLIPIAMEIEAQSLARAIIPRDDEKTYLVVDIGKTRTGYTVVSRGIVLFTATLGSIGGEDLTAAIQKNLNISEEEAEKIKISSGLKRSAQDSRVFESIIPIISIWRDEINRYRNYWETHKDDSEIKDKINGIILSGGQSSLPGLVEYFESNIGLPVEIGNPWINVLGPGKVMPSIDYNNSLRYATAAGLALRSSR